VVFHGKEKERTIKRELCVEIKYGFIEKAHLIETHSKMNKF
jgi:hypothetical protein